MKKLLIVLFSFGIVAAASAQRYDHDRDYRDSRVTVGIGTGPYALDRRIDEINRNFDHRIWEVRTDPRLTRHEKRRMIRRLEDERHDRIREARRWSRRGHDGISVGVGF